VLAVDLGTDSVYAYELDQRSGTLRLITQSALPSGSGPRHLACSGMRAYVVTEYASTVLTCDYQPETGALALRHEVATTSSHVENFPSAIRVSADGRFCYVANRGANTIALINTETEPELLAEVPCGGDWPRDIALSPDGRLLFCANQRSDTVTVFRIDPRTGIPAPTGAALKVSAPTSILLAGHAGKALK
jgi:6-phosphogluconolactonase